VSGTAGEIQVSVVLATYNHEPYLAQSIASVLSQETDRPFELIVSEDCSTDGSREIVLASADRDSRVSVLLSPRNLRSNEVVSRGIAAARGRYVCLLDGDDYWTSPTKLDRQAAFLDAESSISAVFHNAEIGTAESVSTDRWTPATQPHRITREEIWEGNPFATCAGMMRAETLHGLGPWYHGFFPITDWPLYVLCAEHGDLWFEDEVVGVYRLHAGGEYSAMRDDRKLDATARFYARMRALRLPLSDDDVVRRGGSRYFFGWAEEYAARGDRRLALRCLRHALGARGVGRSVQRREFVRLALQLCSR
jgi:glycosyltransferase involved in cell wall biosynthesis